MQSQRGLILFGHGAREPEWARPIERIRDLLRRSHPEALVACAYLEYLTPTLPDCVAELVSSGVSAIVVLPVFIAQGGHLKQELPELLSQLARAYPNCTFELTPAMGEAESVLTAMSAHAAVYLAD